MSCSWKGCREIFVHHSSRCIMGCFALNTKQKAIFDTVNKSHARSLWRSVKTRWCVTVNPPLPRQQIGGDAASPYLLSTGLLLKAEKVRYMTYTLMTPGCSRPDVGWTTATDVHEWLKLPTQTRIQRATLMRALTFLYARRDGQQRYDETQAAIEAQKDLVI